MILKFWKRGLFICPIERVLIADLSNNIACWVGISYFSMHGAQKLKKGTFSSIHLKVLGNLDCLQTAV